MKVKSGEKAKRIGEGQEIASKRKKKEANIEEEITEDYGDEIEGREYGARAASETRVIGEDGETWSGPVTLSNVELVINEGVTLTIEDTVTINRTVTIRGGGNIARGSENAGILVNKSASLTIQRITVDGKEHTAYSSMIQVNGGQLTVEAGSKIQNCRHMRDETDYLDVERFGGAVSLSDGAIAEFHGCTISNCTANNGGAISGNNNSILIVDNGSKIENCHAIKPMLAGFGGAVHLYNANAEFRDCTIKSCSTENERGMVEMGRGGAVRFYGEKKL